jgi:hypothetical protein
MDAAISGLACPRFWSSLLRSGVLRQHDHMRRRQTIERGSEMMTQDFIVTDQSSVWLFEPLTEAARQFVRQQIERDDWLWVGQGFAIDYLAAGALAEDLQNEGFIIHTRH